MSVIQEELNSDLLTNNLDVIRQVLLIRQTEQRLLSLFAEGKLFGTVHTAIGQEFVGVAVAQALKSQDYVFSNHRCHGHFLAYSQNVLGLIAEVMGKATGVCGGLGGSQHLHYRNFFSNGIQGGIIPVATGLAQAQKLKPNAGIAVVFIGDGTLGQGVLYESMNIASKWSLPLLFVCEKNSYAQSTNTEATIAGSITDRAAAFDIKSAYSNTWDWQSLLVSMQKSVDYVRHEQQPFFHLVDTYRLMAHSKGDDLRDKTEVDEFWNRDPLSQIAAQYASDDNWQAMLTELNQLIDDAVKQAETAPFGQLSLPETSVATTENWQALHFPKERIVESIRNGLRNALESNDKVLLMGEDIESPYGGAFKCTLGLSTDFPEQVRNTPISEAAIAGIGNGLAMAGYIPVVEIMFSDFLSLVADQWINHAAKFRGMYNNQVSIPLIIRTPVGGKRGYGATHSQSLEKHFIGLPDTMVLCIHHRYSPNQLYANLFAQIERPTLVLENKVLYGKYATAEVPGGYTLLCTTESFPTVRMRPKISPDITLVAIGGLSIEAEEAALALFQEEEIIVDLFFPTKLYPFNISILKDSLQESRRLLVVEEGQSFVSFSSELLAQAMEQFSSLHIKGQRLTAAPIPIPAARPLEEQCLPAKDTIVKKVMEMCYE
ncbi:MAG: thiamine pyrophosphate-dependent enzyme [Pseudomonadota bacterium]